MIGFQCPLCRGYADLESSVTVEIDEVKKKKKIRKKEK